jgi:catalase (peroxidase I)
MSTEKVTQEAVKKDIIDNIVTPKGNACPMAVRLAWHSAGTYDKSDGSGGTNGATMRYEMEAKDGANAGLDIVRDMLVDVKTHFPDVSISDIWALTGAAAVEKTGGPKIPVGMGRVDQPDCNKCPPNGRLPDASQGAQHLRDVFYRMGFNDQEIVVLSGAHTLGRCHTDRSGFDGPWTKDPLKFDNTYFTNLLDLEWKPREWDGPLQYTDPSGELMMLPTDLALIQDEKFLPFVQLYAKDEDAFFKDFSAAFSKLLSLGCPASVLKSTEEAAKA